MPRSDVKQHRKVTVEQPVVDKTRTVEYWRERFKKVLKNFVSLVHVADYLAEKDADFYGARGYIRLQNIKNEKASLILTSKAVELMEKAPKRVLKGAKK